MSQTSSARAQTLGGLVFRIYTIRGWVRRARDRLTTFRKNDIDEANATGTVVKEVEENLSKNRSFIFFTIDEGSTFFYIWTCLVCIVCMHPLIFLALSVFNNIHPFLRATSKIYFLFDFIYLLDLLIQTRLEYVEHGVAIKNHVKLFRHRIKSIYFILDIFSTIPLDYLNLFGESFFFSRLNRLLKCYRLLNFAALAEIRTSSPHGFRLLKLIFICFVIFHWNGCLYFHISKVYKFQEAFLEDWIFSYDKIINPVLAKCVTDVRKDPNFCHADDFLITDLEEHTVQTTVTRFMSTWDNKTKTIIFADFVRQYALSFYWSALTLVTLGEQPSPVNTFQNLFEIFDTLLGLIIFAVIVGDVGNMVTAINLRKSEFENVLDGCKTFMVYRKVPLPLKKKAVQYFNYVWTDGGGANVDEDEIAEFLPPRLFGEIAVEIHMDTLQKVRLFEDCDPRLLYELILKLKLRVYSPMDYICKKGEVGTEMYIVKEGSVEVVSEDGTKIFVTLGAGTVFGELSILNIPGNKNKNLRTASVRSKGYSDMYVLDKEDLWEALREYPQAKDSLIEKGIEILAKDNMLEEKVGEEDEEEFQGPIEEVLERLKVESEKIEKELANAENCIRKSHQQMKHRIFGVESDLINELNRRKFRKL